MQPTAEYSPTRTTITCKAKGEFLLHSILQLECLTGNGSPLLREWPRPTSHLDNVKQMGRRPLRVAPVSRRKRETTNGVAFC